MFSSSSLSFPSEPRAETEKSARANYLRTEIANWLRPNLIMFEFKVPRFVNESDTLTDDGAKRWTSKFETFAKLVVLDQDLDHAEGRAMAADVESMGANSSNSIEGLARLAA